MSIKHCLLALLSEEPRTAAGLKRAFDDATDSIWPLNIGQVTQTLARLERDGLISGAGEVTGGNGRPTPIYTPTTAGHDELSSWWHSPTAAQRADRDELVLKISLAAVTRAEHILPLLDIQRHATMNQLRELNRQLGTTVTAHTLSIEKRIYDLEAESRWLDRVEMLIHTTTEEDQ
ncbi:PadR family transcriptional regulator [Corynebacterium uterequi]|uniref:Transcriptional regulator, PadR family n=1 Tax=Corynebacterium uterequi TaxID=1072256 RepID=A0A0G3HK46_9CORY|nr:PadR family transcriptional regulator [Corynebacterium uterequi]AKK11527.1 transcriptional regulator, PadR family [Corynebacterium uterequi]